jgi:demethylmenaquinone methyltransferase/2-methoxy-6-polyprenyl-1,4-benzoquinol methylase
MSQNIYNPEYIKGLFNQMSSSYERVNYISSFGFSVRWRRQVLKKVKVTQEKVEVIDLMTGIGEMWNAIAHQLPNATISALDYSESMLEKAKEKNNLKYNGKVNLMLQNVLENELPSNHYDYVTCSFGLKTFNNEQIEVLANEIKRILKPGGQFSFIEVSEPRNKVLKFFYGIYIGGFIPVLGTMLFGRVNEYKMLWRYTKQFKDAKLASECFKSVGLDNTFHSFFFGCATGFSGQKSG